MDRLNNPCSWPRSDLEIIKLKKNGIFHPKTFVQELTSFIHVASGIHPFDVPTGSKDELTPNVGLPLFLIAAASSGVGSLHFHGRVNNDFASNLLCRVIKEFERVSCCITITIVNNDLMLKD